MCASEALTNFETVDHLRADILGHLTVQGCLVEVVFLVPAFGAASGLFKVCDYRVALWSFEFLIARRTC